MRTFGSKNIAFTLAEVLIVMAIIGMIAEMTIPDLMNNVQKQQFTSTFLEDYSILQQASQQLVTENGGNIKGVYPTYNDFFFALIRKLKYMKICPEVTTVGDCWAPITRNLNNPNLAALQPNSLTVVLLNGSSVQVDATPGWFASDCSLGESYSIPWYRGNGSTGVCAMLNVDVNGVAGPNIMGRDTFQFYMPNAAGAFPDGIPGTDDYLDGHWGYCSMGSDDYYNGIACGGRLVVERAMNY